MTGFLGLFTQTERVDVAPGYWVELKKSLSEADMAAVRRALVQPKMKDDGAEGDMDTSLYMEEMVTRAIESWNLTDENDELLPFVLINPREVRGAIDEYHLRRKSVKRLPDVVFRRLFNKVRDFNNEDVTQDPSFRDGSEGGTPDGNDQGRPGVVPDVRAGESAVEAGGLARPYSVTVPTD